LLEKTIKLIKKEGYSVENIDSTICLEKPKVAKYVSEMRKTIASIAEISTESVSVKATTTEKMGITGSEEGLFATASVLLIKKS